MALHYVIGLSVLVCCAAATLYSAEDRSYGDCKGPGLQCSTDCKVLQTCIDSGGSGGYQPVDLKNCSGDTFCNVAEAGCTSDINTCVAAYPLTCLKSGTYPDPYDCLAYHVGCQPGDPSGTPQNCIGKAYDPCTGICDIPLTENKCPTELPVPRCDKAGQSGALLKNRNIFYVCLENENGALVPALSRCENGFFYDEADQKCKESDGGC